ncbi:MAG: hypothetical protein ACI85O_002384 [Saprospiraceae bacterium]|jgi:hypothetical protein
MYNNYTMNTYNTKNLLTAVLIGLSSMLLAQTSTSAYSTKFVSLKSEKKITDKSKNNANVYAYAYTKRIPALYSGYVIELATSELPLKRDYEVFKNFGKIYHDKTQEGYYSYVIIADFNKKESVEDYIKNIVAHQVPDAKIILYKNGKRKEQTSKERKFYMVD